MSAEAAGGAEEPAAKAVKTVRRVHGCASRPCPAHAFLKSCAEPSQARGTLQPVQEPEAPLAKPGVGQVAGEEDGAQPEDASMVSRPGRGRGACAPGR